MVNSYNMGNYPNQQYYPQQVQAYEGLPQYQQQSGGIGGAVVGVSIVGGVAGGTVGYLRNRHPVKDGKVADTFAKDVFNKCLDKNAKSETKEFFKQIQNVLQKLDKTKTSEELKKLLKDNSKILSEPSSAISTNTFLSSINSENIKDVKKSLKNRLGAIMDNELSKTKDVIKQVWDNETKKFTKPDGFKDDKLFNIIKETTSKGQWKKALKYGGITAGVLGGLTLGYKMLTSSSHR